MKEHEYFETFPMFFEASGNIHRVDVPAPWIASATQAMASADSIESAWLTLVNKISSMYINAYQEAHPECCVTLDELDTYINEQQ